LTKTAAKLVNVNDQNRGLQKLLSYHRMGFQLGDAD
jgi:hypothetical protein